MSVSAPVLTLNKAAAHPHNRARGVFIKVEGVTQPAPAPRFNRAKPETPRTPERSPCDTAAALGAWRFAEAEVAELAHDGAFGAKAK